MRVIGPNSEQIGVLPIADALKQAEEAGLDLVEVSPTANPPVCRIIDYGKYRYEQSKKQQGAKQKSTQLKEVKLRPFTDTHDVEFKTRHVKDFLAEGHKVKITVMFRGREMAHQDAGRVVLGKIIEALGPVAQVEQQPRMEGRNMSILLSPKHTGG